MLSAKGTGELEGSNNATVTSSRFNKMAASMMLLWSCSYGLVKRCTSRTARAARFIRNWREGGVGGEDEGGG